MENQKRLRGKKHNQSKTKLFERWASMHARCKPDHKLSEHYFDRGITVCAEWGAFMAFKGWAESNGFSKELQLDRRDNDKGYSPDNCRWVTGVVNNLNRTVTIMVEYFGEVLPLAELCNRLNLNKKMYSNIRYRLTKGWSVHHAINKPIKKFSHISY